MIDMLENSKDPKETPAVPVVKESVTSEATEQETAEAIATVENEVAADAEKETAVATTTVAMPDYEAMSLEALVQALETLLKTHTAPQLKNNLEALKSAFNTQFGAILAEKKAAFLADGGNAIDFHFSSPVKTAYNKLLTSYKTQRDAYYSSLEKQLKENLEKRNEIITSLKELIEKGDAKTMYTDFKKLDATWKSIGGVPKTKYNDTWKIYHHHVERFYDLLHLNNDFRALDFKHNLEEKLKLIVQAEALETKEDINEAFKELQALHKTWKEDVGPVGKEHREDVWGKFSAATKKIHDKRHEYFRSMKTKYQDIITLKLAAIEALFAYDASKNKTHKDWQKSIKEVEVLRKKYFDAGKLPYAKSEEVWQKFKAATKQFNTAKNIFYKQEKSSQNTNLQQKIALIALAESLKDSEDWDTATAAMKKVQADWKKVGHVPRKFSDDLWKQFKAACNHYFDRLHEQKNDVNKEQQAVIDAKKEFLETFKAAVTVDLESVLAATEAWRALGTLPKDVRYLETKFNKQVDAKLGSLSLGVNEIALLKFKNFVNGALAQEDFKKLDYEQISLRKKIDELTREVQQLENNLSFIKNATEDNPFVKNVRMGVAKCQSDMEIFKEKLQYLKGLNY